MALRKVFKLSYRIINLITLCLLFFTCSSCVYETKLDQIKSEPKLVVFGYLTNGEEPSVVRLTKTASVGYGLEEVNELVSNAVVKVRDDQEKEIHFTPQGSGEYLVENFKGEIGKSYKLIIQFDGKTYESEPEVLRAPPAVDNLYYEYKTKSSIVEEGFYTYVDFSDPADEENYYVWMYEKYMQKFICGQQQNCCEYYCFKKTSTEHINIISDQFFDGQKFAYKEVHFQPYDGRAPLVLKVKQLSISREAFLFLNAVDVQIKGAGDIFATPAFTIRGNIKNINNPEETVLGYFAVAGETVRYIKIDRTLVVNPPLVNNDDKYLDCIFCPPCAPCLEDDDTTVEIPPTWND